MKFRIIFYTVLCLFAALFGSDFFSYFNNYTTALYSEKEFIHSQYSVSNGWDKICGVYADIYNYRINSTGDITILNEKIEDIIKSLKRNKIKRITPYENEFLTASLYGSLAYIRSEDPSFGMLRNVDKAMDRFRDLEKTYKTTDSGFGSALSEIALGLYFENSFWVSTVFGKKGDISKGIIKLNSIAFNGDISKIESNLFLIEYFADILRDHNSSVKYSENLNKIYPGSRYFKYLYAKDLYHTGKIRSALRLFRSVNDSLSDRFYTFDYESIIYETKCLYILNENDKAQNTLKYASDIHDGFILHNLRNDWLYSVKIRQEAVFRIQNSPVIAQKLSDDEKKRIIAVYFDHGYFRELKRLTGTMTGKDAETLILEFRTAVIMNEWNKADEIMDILENKHEKNFERNIDIKRLEILINIKDNFLRTKK
jgi:tetratricopeptide (TPR) repeat protein